MCGIAGIVGPGVGRTPEPRVSAMLTTLARRGPDDQAWTAFPNCILANTRLSILDLSTGHQPLYDAQGGVAITFNGEIYNFRELRSELAAKGHRFATHSDTEVILKAYLEYGADCVAHLDGMFAFALWDENANHLFLARDRFGKKPLHYAFDDGGVLVFASEIKTLFASGRIRGVIDYEAIDAYLRLLYVPPDRTVYANVMVVRPGETRTFKSGHMSSRRYWSLKYEPSSISYGEAKEEVRRLLQDAVRRRMVADVEIGALLSGGVDSTIVTQLAQGYTSRPIKTFSVGYGNHIDELPFAKAASDRIGADAYVLQVGGDTIPEELHKVASYFDEPHGDTSNVAQHLISRLAQSKVKVVLSGDGGDEVFLGYPWYCWQWQMTRRDRLKQILFSSVLGNYLRAIQVFRPEHRRPLWNGRPPGASQIVPDELRRFRPKSVQAVNLFDLTAYLPGQLLVKADRAGMMNSLEVRSPFLDHKLAQFVFNLPTEYKTDRRTGKVILKDLLSEVMPRDFVNRPKQGFGAPVREWLQTSCRPLVRDLFASPNAAIYGCMNRAYVNQMIEGFYSGRDTSSYLRIWGLLCLEMWFVAHQPQASSDPAPLAWSPRTPNADTVRRVDRVSGGAGAAPES